MNFRSTIVGLAASALMLALLGFARIFVVSADVPDLAVREIETVNFDPPPPPPPPEEPPPDAPPPPPTLTNVSTLPDPTRVPVPQADVPIDITLPVENFHADLAPAPLPTSPTPPKPSQHSKQFFKKEQNYKRTPPPPPAAKSHYSTSELDGTPRLLRHGSATFPASLARQGVSRGTVVLEVELSTVGSVSVQRVVSSTHPDLVPPARRVASSARFTPPKRNGKAVKAIMRWPIIIEK